MVCLTPVGSSDTASYAAYGRIAALGGNPYTTNPLAFLGAHSPYTKVVGTMWKAQPSVYGPFATVIQSFAASIGHANVATTIWVLMILNGIVFIGVGLLLLLTSDDPVRATLFWTANPVLILELVSGGHLDTLVAAAAIGAIQVARRFTEHLGRRRRRRADRPGLRGEDLRGADRPRARLAAAARPRMDAHHPDRPRWPLATLAPEYAPYGLGALKPVFGGLKLVTLPSPWRVFELIGSGARRLRRTPWPRSSAACGRSRCSSWPGSSTGGSPRTSRREVVAPFALTFAWILVAPWVFAWYTARGLGRADPGAAQPDDPMADDRHGPPRPLPVQRRPRRPGHMTALLSRHAGPRIAARPGGTPHGPGSRGGTGWPSSC